ncbi:Os08g0564400 [Oryza sativa Japonica Group]|uniref:Os08g0564400 protein n=2 Tax=Oryza sativa subsp. japonica TaxID=39947 RepID=Q0J3M1_ORYSJ|nr:hypothetical protein EE612_045980 [Oryza sativa]BAF24444.1 Os08g0564400 [Oryza sativa Japonica Group]BAT06741.1 Os08g0564400 [Oryza sativa Japonica Group]|eukprot:NP_001062530.1 Os08g0564400 [Oryza sativa Japonica Group]
MNTRMVLEKSDTPCFTSHAAYHSPSAYDAYSRNCATPYPLPAICPFQKHRRSGPARFASNSPTIFASDPNAATVRTFATASPAICVALACARSRSPENPLRNIFCRTVAATTSGKTASSTSARRHCRTKPAVQATSMSAEFWTMMEMRSPMAERTFWASSASLAAMRALELSSMSNQAISLRSTAASILSRTRLVRFSPTVSQKRCWTVLKSRAAEDMPMRR